ncbi:hypothetical protein [Leptolyngbya sp. BC1307]|uniref:hypothetical protein n=1 Tax=Leptolyngbya sp. BC1307 TaxID=2029589 RepID=UPI000EFADB9F|nr:hypothetical protein [Leptolyngbya sp. BC1307]
MPIDIDRLRQSIRQDLDTDELLILLDRAIELIEPDQLPQLLKGILAIDSFQADETTTQSLLEDVEDFRDDSLAGLYYEAFRVNSRNFMDMSRETTNWIEQFERLINRCIRRCRDGEYVQTQQAFKILFNLLDEIDKGGDTIIFFADEAGSWQVGVEWAEVLPCYFTALAEVAKPEPFAQDVIHLVTAHIGHDRDMHLSTALKLAKPSQRKALKRLIQT